MRRSGRGRRWAWALVGVLGCAPSSAPVSGDTPLVVTRGELAQHLLLTGEVETSDATDFPVPRTDEWNLSVQWLAEDGARVEKGAPLVSFDNTAVLDKLSELELAMIEAGVDLTAQEAKAAVAGADQRFAVQEQRTAVAKAKLDTEVPAEILSRKEGRDFALALSRAQAELNQARGELRKIERGEALQTGVQKIAYDKAERAYERAEEQLNALEIKAPRAGIFVVKKHPWQDRKLQVGDNVWPGMKVGGLPDLTKLVIHAELSDVDEGRLHAGMAITCVVDAYPQMPIAGVIRSVTPVAQESEARARRRFFTVLVELETLQEQRLRPGLSARVDVVTRHVDDALIAPREALSFEESEPRALLANGDTVAVEIEFCTARACAITSGLDEGQVLAHRREAT